MNNKASKGSEAYFSGIHIGSSNSAVPYIYTDGTTGNINFRYKDNAGNTQYSSVNALNVAIGNIKSGAEIVGGSYLLRSGSNTPIYGKTGMEYLNTTGDGTTSGANKNSTPVANAWFHKLRMNHENADGYYTELALPMTDDLGIHYRVISSGNEIIKWRKLIDSNSIDVVKRHPSYTNTMYLGWSGSSIICRVDSTDFKLTRASLSGTTLTISI